MHLATDSLVSLSWSNSPQSPSARTWSARVVIAQPPIPCQEPNLDICDAQAQRQRSTNCSSPSQCRITSAHSSVRTLSRLYTARYGEARTLYTLARASLASMQRRSSGSSQDSADASVKASRTRDNASPKTVSSTNLQPCDSPPPTSARNRISNSQLNWQQSQSRNGASDNESGTSRAGKTSGDINTDHDKLPPPKIKSRQFRPKSPWAISIWTLLTSMVGIALLASIVYSAANLQCDPKGCRMSWMSPSFVHFSDFDTEHTRFASKYSLHLYREQGIENRPKVCTTLFRDICLLADWQKKPLGWGDSGIIHTGQCR